MDPRLSLPEPMRRFECNQQGCCCSGWRIPFRAHDLVRLRTHLAQSDRPAHVELARVLGEGAPEGFPGGPDGSCVFLEGDRKRCAVHADHGLGALADVCVDFPVVATRGHASIELHFDPVCPAVLDRLVDDEGPIRILEGPAWDEGTQLRASRPRATSPIRVGARLLDPGTFDLARRRIAEALEDASRPVGSHLQAIDAMYAELAAGAVEPRIRLDRDPGTYLVFLEKAVAEHGAGTLRNVWDGYRRFVFAIPREGRGFDRLAKALQDADGAWAWWLGEGERAHRASLLRYVAHRHLSPFLTIDGVPKFAARAVPWFVATALRYAWALSKALQRPIDRDVLKVALGCSEYVYRSLEIAPDSLTWFGIDG